MREPKPTHTMRNISLVVILLFILGGILFPMFKKMSQTPTFHKPTNIVSGEVTPNNDKEDSKLKPGEICMKHPDFFIFPYSLETTKINTGGLYNQFGVIQDLAEKGAIALITPGKLNESIDQDCFPGNPIWIITESGSQNKTLELIAGEYQVPLFADQPSLSGYVVHILPLELETKGEFFHETLRKYLELESGGFLKNID